MYAEDKNAFCPGGAFVRAGGSKTILLERSGANRSDGGLPL